MPEIVTSPQGMQLRFPGAAGIIYTVEMSATLDKDWEVLTTHTGSGQIVSLPLQVSEPAMFFRVKAGGR
jgi:hypothetical protein